MADPVEVAALENCLHPFCIAHFSTLEIPPIMASRFRETRDIWHFLWTDIGIFENLKAGRPIQKPSEAYRMYEVRFHGRGGQGAVMAAQALASAAFQEGGYATAFPFFGAERRGAPVLAFTRIDNKRIYRKTQVYEPDFVVVLDEGLVDTVNVVEGLKKGGMVIVNTAKKPEDVDVGIDVKIATVDATSVALEVLKQPATNSAILGAIAKATGLVKIESVEKGIMQVFGDRLGAKVGELNGKAARVAYDRTIVGVTKGHRLLKTAKKWLPDVNELPLGGASIPMKTEAGLVGPGSFVESKTGSWRVFKPEYDNEKCIMCNFCWFYCPEGCIDRNGDRMEFDLDYCKGCGICSNECPVEAIKMVR
jgi:2-oxoacid:acceptor oxidoreductase gamma subunit (pyruvate/2-ketoisovalerate family)/2-oxoacid:acceptor oxidoreductase delta subunit (pyruvate/2-ketoisovalerate family)